MARGPTWNNVNAPTATGASQILSNAARNLQDGFTGLEDTLGKTRERKSDEYSNNLIAEMSGVTTEAGVEDFLAKANIDGSLVNDDLRAALLNFSTGVVNNNQTRQQTSNMFDANSRAEVLQNRQIQQEDGQFQFGRDVGGLVAQAGAAGAFSNAIGSAESGGGADQYDATLGFRNRTDGVRVSQMTLGELNDYSTGEYAQYSKDWKRENNHGNANVPSTPMGKYQIVGDTLRGIQKELNLPDNVRFSPEVQELMGTYLGQKRVNGPRSQQAIRDGLRNEWEGFRGKSDAELDVIAAELRNKPTVSREDIIAASDGSGGTPNWLANTLGGDEFAQAIQNNPYLSMDDITKAVTSIQNAYNTSETNSDENRKRDRLAERTIEENRQDDVTFDIGLHEKIIAEDKRIYDDARSRAADRRADAQTDRDEIARIDTEVGTEVGGLAAELYLTPEEAISSVINSGESPQVQQAALARINTLAEQGFWQVVEPTTSIDIADARTVQKEYNAQLDLTTSTNDNLRITNAATQVGENPAQYLLDKIPGLQDIEPSYVLEAINKLVENSSVPMTPEQAAAILAENTQQTGLVQGVTTAGGVQWGGIWFDEEAALETANRVFTPQNVAQAARISDVAQRDAEGLQNLITKVESIDYKNQLAEQRGQRPIAGSEEDRATLMDQIKNYSNTYKPNRESGSTEQTTFENAASENAPPEAITTEMSSFMESVPESVSAIISNDAATPQQKAAAIDEMIERATNSIRLSNASRSVVIKELEALKKEFLP